MISLAAALLIGQNDEWSVCRRYLPAESMNLLDAVKDSHDPLKEKRRGGELNAA